MKVLHLALILPRADTSNKASYIALEKKQYYENDNEKKIQSKLQRVLLFRGLQKMWLTNPNLLTRPRHNKKSRTILNGL
jgi:hypothetical protein